MSEDHKTATCSHCGSGNLAFGIRLGMTAEVGDIGPQFKDGLLLVGTESLHIDLCTACGHVQRLYVKNPNHRWLT
jgi:ribosomal protein L37E